MRLSELAAYLAAALGVQHKQEIQAAARAFPAAAAGPWGPARVRLGEDCAAIPDGDG
jgi:selenophosphate synthetase-related protein